jgi:hypothetical protein
MDAIIDTYVINRSGECLIFKSQSIETLTGDFNVPQPQVRWIIPPPKCIEPQQTVFFRLYSGEVSTTSASACSSPVEFGYELFYEVESLERDEISPTPRPSLTWNVFKLRPASANACANVPEFGPVRVQNYDSDSSQVEIYYLEPPPGPRTQIATDWHNTVVFLIS